MASLLAWIGLFGGGVPNQAVNPTLDSQGTSLPQRALPVKRRLP